jgi:hypothetical protein
MHAEGLISLLAPFKCAMERGKRNTAVQWCETPVRFLNSDFDYSVSFPRGELEEIRLSGAREARGRAIHYLPDHAEENSA